jgi:hypothetical protein
MASTRISAKDRAFYLKRALQAADWFVNAQIKCERVWMSDHGRFVYYYYMPEKKHVPGLNWTHGRAIFVLSEAYRITGDRRYLESMELGARYMMALQPLDPGQPITHGSIHEEIPQSPWGGMLDGAQAASGFLMLYKATKNPDFLRRGKAFCDFLLRTWRPDLGLAQRVGYYPESVGYFDRDNPYACIHQATAIPLWHLYRITGEGQYTPILVDAADRILRCQRPDGGIYFTENSQAIAKVPLNHHWGLGETHDEKCLLRNDDAIVVVIQAAYEITKNPKYLDALVRYGEWIMANEPHVRPYNAFGVQANNVLDIAKMAGKNWTPWVLDHLQKHCLDLQALGTRDARAEGGFRGEDEEGNAGIFGGKSLDYVPTRNTCYMTGLLYRLSGKGNGAGFSFWGADGW